MKFRGTLILGILVLLLGAYAYFIEYKGTEKKKEKEEQKKTLMEVKKEDLSELRIDRRGETIRLVPGPNETWNMTAPLKTRADEQAVGGLLSSFEKLQYSQVVTDKPRDLAQYGLEKPEAVLHFTLKKGKGKRIDIGLKNPVDNSSYVRLEGDPKIYLTEADVQSAATTTLFDLRDKKLTDFSGDKVLSLELRTTGADLKFRREDGVWKLTSPVQSPASESDVGSLVSGLEFLRASRFADDPAADYGFAKPSAVVRLQLEKGATLKIDFGNKQGEDIYVKVEGVSEAAAVSDSFSTYFGKSVDDWREKKLIVFNRYDAEELRLRSGGKEYRFRRGKEDAWREESPQSGEVESEALQDVLEKLETAEIQRYGDRKELGGPALTEVFLTMKDWQDKVTRKHLAFGPVEGNVQAVRNDDYPAVVFAPVDLSNELIKALDQLKVTKAKKAER